MEQTQQSFLDLVKSEILDKDESLSSIPNIWNTEFKDLLYVVNLETLDNNTKVGLSFDKEFQLSQETKQKVIDLFEKYQILL